MSDPWRTDDGWGGQLVCNPAPAEPIFDRKVHSDLKNCLCQTLRHDEQSWGLRMTQDGYVPVDEVKRWLKRELHSVKDEHVNKVLLTSTEDDGERSFTTTVDHLGMKWVKANRGHTIHHVCVQAEHNKMHQTEMVPPPPSYPPRPDHPPPPRLPPPPDEPQVVCRSVPGHQASLSDAPEERYAPIRHRHEEDGRTTVSAAKPKGPPSHHRQSGGVQEFYTSPREDHEASRTMSWKASTESSGSSKSRLTAVGTPGTALGDFQGAEYQNYDSNDNYLSFRSGDRHTGAVETRKVGSQRSTGQPPVLTLF